MSTVRVIMDNIINTFKDRNDKLILYLPLHIEFLFEKGLDIGGVIKDFFSALFQEIVKKEEGMFIQNEQNNFRFVGIMLAEAVLSQVTVPVRFDFFILKTLLGLPPSLSDLSYISPDEYNNLKNILAHDISEFDNTFSINITNDNKCEYAQMVLIKKLLSPSITYRLYSLRDGFHLIIPHK